MVRTSKQLPQNNQIHLRMVNGKNQFLGTWVQKGQDRNKLYTNLYTKPTDTNSYLRYDSAHPPKCKESIPYSQFLRIKRICKEQTDFETNLEMKKTEFREKGYPTRILNNAEKAIRELERSNLLKTNAKNKAPLENTVVLTTTYHQGEQYVPRTMKKNWDILARSCTTKGMYRNKLLTGYRKPKSLHNHLVRAKVNYHPEKGESTNDPNRNACPKKDCIYCNLLETSGKLKFADREIETKHNITCNSSNLIYCIECTKCQHKYVGQTKRKIKDRMREHLYGIKKQKDTDVSYHFNTNGHKGKHDMKVYILDFIFAHPESTRSKSLRHKIEFNWIQRLQTVAPKGMNVLDNQY